MLEYLPWAHSTLDIALEKYSRHIFSILDVELGGECNYRCVYCESPDRNKKCKIPIDGIMALAVIILIQNVICVNGHITFGKIFLITDVGGIMSCILFPVIVMVYIINRFCWESKE